MRLTRWSHSCVVLEAEGRKLVIDPGGWSEPRALNGVDAVLVTHEHGDHVDTDRVRASASRSGRRAEPTSIASRSRRSTPASR